MNSLLRKINVCFLTCLFLWLGGLVWFTLQIPAQPLEYNDKADAIVVLTGGGGRTDYGLELLADGKANRLFISGVHEAVTPQSLIKHAPDAIRKRLKSSAAQSIILGHEAENTIGNAEETARWVAAQNMHTILLVTANYHMPRSIEEFKNILTDVNIIPAPVFNEEFSLKTIWMEKAIRSRLLSEYHKYIASKFRHWLILILNHT